ncbi:glycine betaine ABC transporter substrate-binding protein [Corynebacterium sp.]|uniref:glycine betaine ABC transporter substrate-binding protein n=1 Tax=Corynebacterium sp. TaxID=1720 RepID=UPI0028AA4475|nr:glycine betaine ABC transporter substrate-binding protein [Corynebacterium sp.]
MTTTRTDIPRANGRVRILALLTALSAMLVSACGLGTAGGYSPSGTLSGDLEDVDLSGASVAVGSKNFTEQILLGKMAVILFQSAGADVQDLTNIPGSSSARQAMIEGDVNMQWEYTGSAWTTYLNHDDPIPDEQKQYEAVRDEEKANGLVWLPPAPMNNTYGFATTKEVADRLGVSTLSDMANVPRPERTLCVESEFANRNDGLIPMLEAYGLSPADVDQSLMDTGAVYAATAGGTCNFGEVFTTDGRIKALDLQILEDDRQFFPKYNLSAVVAQGLIDDYPQIADLFAPVSEKLDDESLIDLNAQIDVDGEEPTDVAWDWLRDEGFIEG